MKKIRVKVVAMLVALAMIFSVVPGMAAAAGAESLQEARNIDKLSVNISDNLSAEDLVFLNKMTSIFHEFSSDDNGKLVLDISTNTLMNDYNFTENEIHTLQIILKKAQQSSYILTPKYTSFMSPPRGLPENFQAITANSRWGEAEVYFTHDEVMAFLFAAAQLGPSALKIALFTLSTILGGPVGAALAVMLVFIGFPGLESIAYAVLQAAVNKQGVYIKFHMNGPFPNISSGTW